MPAMQIIEGEDGKLKLIERIKIGLISRLGYWVIRLIGRTLRWEARDWQYLEAVHAAGKRLILAFWHGRIFMATYYFRRRGIVVMISQNRDGEYIARVIERFGYGVARGSSTRGSPQATVEILRALKAKRDVGFAMDGPRGPRYVAKPGAAFVASKSGNPVVPFSISVERKWVMRSWDHFVVPKPFSKALVSIGSPVYVPEDATEEDMRLAERQIQDSLDNLRDRGDAFWGGEPDR
jgi:lysophospholipid acyltransferase (LPLAT)-like uncharacterized protein